MTFETFIENNIGLIHKLAHRYSIKGYTHDDKVQEALTKLFEVFDRYNDKYAQTTFIQAVLTKYFLDMIKESKAQSRQNYNTNGDMLGEIKGYDFSLIKDEKSFEQRVMVTAITLAMTKSDRHILLPLLYGETYTSVAERTGMSRQKVSKDFNEFLLEVKEEIK